MTCCAIHGNVGIAMLIASLQHGIATLIATVYTSPQHVLQHLLYPLNMILQSPIAMQSVCSRGFVAIFFMSAWALHPPCNVWLQPVRSMFCCNIPCTHNTLQHIVHSILTVVENNWQRDNKVITRLLQGYKKQLIIVPAVQVGASPMTWPLEWQ